jgi:hypothetical protein
VGKHPVASLERWIPPPRFLLSQPPLARRSYCASSPCRRGRRRGARFRPLATHAIAHAEALLTPTIVGAQARRARPRFRGSTSNNAESLLTVHMPMQSIHFWAQLILHIRCQDSIQALTRSWRQEHEADRWARPGQHEHGPEHGAESVPADQTGGDRRRP